MTVNGHNLEARARSFAEWASLMQANDEEERYGLVCVALDHNTAMGLALANRFLRRRAHFEYVLERGLRTADASQIQWWLACVLPRLGLRRVLRLLEKALSTYPREVDKAAYWIPRLAYKLSTDEEKHVRSFLSRVYDLPAT